MKRRPPVKSKMDFVKDARLCLASAEINLVSASADLGTPEEIDDARCLIKHARMALQDLIERHGES